MARKIRMSRRDFLRATAAGSMLAGTSLIPGMSRVFAQDVQEVTVMFWDGPPLIGIREKALEPFNDAYPDCRLNFTSVPGGPNQGYNDKLFTSLAAGIPPDVFIIEIGELPGFLNRDLLVDIKPFIEADNYDLSQFPDLAIEAYSQNAH